MNTTNAQIGAVVVLMAMALPAHATVFTWIDPAGGGYLDDNNWSPVGDPNGSSDSTVFNLGSAYTVILGGPIVGEHTVSNIDVTAGTVTFDMFEQINPITTRAVDYELTSTTASAHIGSAPGSLFAAKLVALGAVGNDGIFAGRSTFEADGFLHIGRDANSSGVLELNGAAWEGAGITYVGLNGSGRLDLINGGSMTNTAGLVGFSPGSTGVVNVGPSGSWDNSGELSVGGFGSGTVTVNDFSEINSDGGVIAANPGSNGTVTLAGGGDWYNTGSLYVGGGSSSPGGSANLTVNSLSDLTVGGHMKVYPTATFALNDGIVDVTGDFDWLKPATLTIDAKDRLTADVLTIAPGGGLTFDTDPTDMFAHLTVGQLIAPAGSFTWNSGPLNITNDDFSIDNTAPIGDLLVLDGDQPLNVSGTLRVGADGEGGTLFMIDGVQVTSGGGVIGNTNPASSTSPVAVDQPGSTWTLTDDLSMGNVAGAGAQLVITNEGRVDGVDAYVSPNPGLHSEVLIQSTSGVSTWDNTGSVYLGGNASTAGGTVEATINSGGALGVAGTLRVWGQAVLTVDGGTVSTPLLDLSGTLNHTHTLDLTGAGLIVDLALNGGTINAPLVDYGARDLAGAGTINGKVLVGGSVIPTGDLTIGDANFFDGVVIGGDLTVDTHHVTIHKKGFLSIGASTTITGGTLTAPNGVAIPVGAGITASGTIDAPVVQQSGSVIDVSTGNLALGDANSVVGFFSDGQIVVSNGGKLTLRDANEAVLGSLTDIGSDGIVTLLAASNGLLLEPGKNIVGHGIINTPNDPLKPFTNNGHVVGLSAADPLTLRGYVKGIGTLDNVVITGTDAPGLSIAAVQRGNVVYQGNMQIEIDGPTNGGFDTITHAGTATLDGTLEPVLINGYLPVLGDTFTFLTAASINGVFESLIGADLGNGLAFGVQYDANSATLEVINALLGDLDGDGFVGINDLNIVLANWNQNVPPANPLADPSGDGFVGIDDLNTVLGNWNAGTPPNSTANTPEPASATLIAASGLALLRRR